MPRAQTRPSATNKSPRGLILPIKLSHGAVCQSRAARRVLPSPDKEHLLFPTALFSTRLQLPVELSLAAAAAAAGVRNLLIKRSTKPQRVMFPNYLPLFTQLR